MFTLDASVFVRDLTPNDPDHAACRELLDRLRANSSLINAPLLLLAEVAGVLSRELRDPMRGLLAIVVRSLTVAKATIVSSAANVAR
jgi:predicted nucleic acid-binding protein